MKKARDNKTMQTTILLSVNDLVELDKAFETITKAFHKAKPLFGGESLRNVRLFDFELEEIKKGADIMRLLIDGGTNDGQD